MKEGRNKSLNGSNYPQSVFILLFWKYVNVFYPSLIFNKKFQT